MDSSRVDLGMVASPSEIGNRLKQFAKRQKPAGRNSRIQQELAASQLSRSGYPSLRRLTCEVNDGVIVLTGRVDSYHMKQMAQTFVRDVPGITVLVNNVEVVDLKNRS